MTLKRRIQRRYPMLLAVLLVLALSAPAMAGLPGAGQHYPNGSSDMSWLTNPFASTLL